MTVALKKLPMDIDSIIGKSDGREKIVTALTTISRPTQNVQRLPVVMYTLQ